MKTYRCREEIPAMPTQQRWSSFLRFFVVVGFATAFTLSNAWAAPISVGLNLAAGSTTQYEYQTDYAAWLVADLSDPITPTSLLISPGRDAGRWIQKLTFGAGFPALQHGDTFFVQEFLTIGSGDSALTNWSQQILTPDWQWDDASIFDQSTSNLVSGFQATLSPTLATFSFSPLDPGTSILVIKTIEFIGTSGTAPSPITIQAFTSVPEPSSLGLLICGLASLLWFRDGGSAFSRGKVS